MKKPQIWIVDDNILDCHVIKTMLEINNLAKEVQVFSNNNAVLEKANLLKENETTQAIHIITENKTSSVNGWQLIKNLSPLNTNLRFHMTSEKYSEKDLNKFEKTDPLYSLNKKPLRLGDLIKIIDS